MASFADLLKPESKAFLESIITKEHEAFDNKRRKLYESRGFKSFEELFSYLKNTGRRVYIESCSDYGIYIQWSFEEGMIRKQGYHDNDWDMTVGYGSSFYTEEEFIEELAGTYGEMVKGINKFEYVNYWLRDEEHPVEEYDSDDIFYRQY